MSGLSFEPGTKHLIRLGLVYVAKGNGSPQDYEVRKAAKAWRCTHRGPWSRPLDTECIHPRIEPGEVYVQTRQSFMESDPLAMECAIAARIYRKADS